MKQDTIIFRYIFKEIILPFVLCIVFFSSIFLMANLLQLTNYIVNYGVSILDIIVMLLFTMPIVLVFVIPISVMLAILLAFLRMSSDNEIIALTSSGTSIYGLLPPVISFCILGFMLSSFITICGEPWARVSMQKKAISFATSNINIGFKEKTFNNAFKGIMIYVNKINKKNNMLSEIFIEDQRKQNIPTTILASTGELITESKKEVFHLLLYDGMINQVDIKNKSVNSVNFNKYEIKIDPHKKGSTGLLPTDARDMDLVELYSYINKLKKNKTEEYFNALMELHRKFALPFACFALGILAVPLGISSQRTSKASGLGLSLFFVLIYYLLLSAGKVLSESGTLAPIIGLWMPDVIMGSLGIFLLIRMANDNPVNLDFIFYIKKQIMRLTKRNKVYDNNI